MERAGFGNLAALDFNHEAIEVFRKNFPKTEHVLEKDLTKFPPEELAKLIGVDQVDVIVGGPPCQGFSTVRQRDGANNGPRMVHDNRRQLYQEFLRYVSYFRPKVFVMENVLGIKSAAGGIYFSRVQQEGRALGYRVHPKVERGIDLGVPQRRTRQLIVGTRLDLPDYFPADLELSPRAVDWPTLGAAIGDLPILRAGQGEEESEYDMDRRKAHVSKHGRRFLYETLEVQLAAKLTAHRARPHSERDLRDFARLKEGEHCAEAMKRGVQFEFPYDRESFKDRYTRQHRDEPCSTIVAHLSKDGLMFIHPTQNRSLTPREAARVQTFPDWFVFNVARTHQFRMIGNAVPPLVSESVGLTIKKYLAKAAKKSERPSSKVQTVPSSQSEALECILVLLRGTDEKALRKINHDDFKRVWHSIIFLYAELHPDSALAHGEEVCIDVQKLAHSSVTDTALLAKRYAQSGWPVALTPLLAEARRRFETGELTPEDFYCDAASLAGFSHIDHREINYDGPRFRP
jgi:DNA (cytosine-5)-methyltransferase 1